jgi:hypothetical protein
MIVRISYDKFGVKIVSVVNAYHDYFDLKSIGNDMYEFTIEKDENELPYMFAKRIKTMAKRKLLIRKLKSC